MLNGTVEIFHEKRTTHKCRLTLFRSQNWNLNRNMLCIYIAHNTHISRKQRSIAMSEYHYKAHKSISMVCWHGGQCVSAAAGCKWFIAHTHWLSLTHKSFHDVFKQTPQRKIMACHRRNVNIIDSCKMCRERIVLVLAFGDFHSLIIFSTFKFHQPPNIGCCCVQLNIRCLFSLLFAP